MIRIEFKDVRAAIERWRSELPELLRASYQAFIAKLDSVVQEGSEDRLLKLFDSYPAAYQAYQRLLEILV